MTDARVLSCETMTDRTPSMPSGMTGRTQSFETMTDRTPSMPSGMNGRIQSCETMTDRTSSEMLSALISKSVAEVRQIVEEEADELGISREDAIQQKIDSFLLGEQRTPSEWVAGFVGGDRDGGRNLLSFAHSWNQLSMEQLLSLGGTDLDEYSLRVEMFSRQMGLDQQRAEQILRIAREEAARTSLPLWFDALQIANMETGHL